MLALLTTASLNTLFAKAAELNCVERIDPQGNKIYFGLDSVSSGTQGMGNTQIAKPKRFFTVDLPGGINYSRNRNGGMEFWSGICVY